MFKSTHDSRIILFNTPLRGTTHAVLLLAALLGGCGMEAATTAATGAAIKKQEVDAGKKTMGEVQQKVEQAAQQMQRAQAETEAASK